MEEQHRRNLQDDYLNQLCKDQTFVSIFLINGIKLNGKIEAFDTYTIMLKDGVTQAIFKHAISTIMPNIGPQWRPTENRMQHHRHEY